MVSRGILIRPEQIESNRKGYRIEQRIERFGYTHEGKWEKHFGYELRGAIYMEQKKSRKIDIPIWKKSNFLFRQT